MAGTTTPDGIMYPTAGDKITPIASWFVNLANSVQTALTNLRNYVNTKVWGGATRTTTQDLPAAETTLLFNSLQSGQSSVTLVSGGLRPSVAGTYLITGGVWSQINGSQNTWRDVYLKVNGVTVAKFACSMGPSGQSHVAYFPISYPLPANATVTVTSVGSQPAVLQTDTHMEIVRVSA